MHIYLAEGQTPGLTKAPLALTPSSKVEGSYPSLGFDAEVGWVSVVFDSSSCPPAVEQSLL